MKFLIELVIEHPMELGIEYVRVFTKEFVYEYSPALKQLLQITTM
jgi:hypothetical protein